MPFFDPSEERESGKKGVSGRIEGAAAMASSGGAGSMELGRSRQAGNDGQQWSQEEWNRWNDQQGGQWTQGQWSEWSAQQVVATAVVEQAGGVVPGTDYEIGAPPQPGPYGPPPPEGAGGRRPAQDPQATAQTWGTNTSNEFTQLGGSRRPVIDGTARTTFLGTTTSGEFGVQRPAVEGEARITFQGTTTSGDFPQGSRRAPHIEGAARATFQNTTTSGEFPEKSPKSIEPVARATFQEGTVLPNRGGSFAADVGPSAPRSASPKDAKFVEKIGVTNFMVSADDPDAATQLKTVPARRGVHSSDGSSRGDSRLQSRDGKRRIYLFDRPGKWKASYLDVIIDGHFVLEFEQRDFLYTASVTMRIF